VQARQANQEKMPGANPESAQNQNGEEAIP
jgi:hypothetical protein